MQNGMPSKAITMASLRLEYEIRFRVLEKGKSELSNWQNHDLLSHNKHLVSNVPAENRKREENLYIHIKIPHTAYLCGMLSSHNQPPHCLKF